MTQPAEPQEKSALAASDGAAAAIRRGSLGPRLDTGRGFEPTPWVRPRFMTLAALAVVGGAGGLATRPPGVIAELRHAVAVERVPLPVIQSEAEIPPAPVQAQAITASTPRIRASSEMGSIQLGQATYFANMLEGRPTASGEPLDQKEMVAAHRDHPFGTWLKVTDDATGKSVVVRVIDRGPFEVPNRETAVIDLSRAAAAKIDMVRRGRIRVTIEVIPAPRAADGSQSEPTIN